MQVGIRTWLEIEFAGILGSQIGAVVQVQCDEIVARQDIGITVTLI